MAMKLSLPKASAWLPAIAAFLCLSLFAMAALLLVSVGSDPKSGPAPVVTSVSAQGFQGLRRLLTAEGHVTATNRFEDGDNKSGRDQITRGDVEIITFEAYNPYADLLRQMEQSRSSASSSSSSGEEEGASNSSASASESADEQAAPAENNGPVPDKRRADHILYQPLGKAVIIVLPKWRTAPARTNPRWGADAGLVPASGIGERLSFLSPMAKSGGKDDKKVAATDGTSLEAQYNAADKALDAHAPDAVAKLRAVAEAGYPQAQYRLGLLYSGEGKYLPEDAAVERQWMQKAADGGVTDAMYELGNDFYNGYGGPMDRALAAKWYLVAAERGVVDCQYNLGFMYENGYGVPKDLAEAYKWYRIAANSGDQEAGTDAKAIGDKLKATDRDRAERAALDFVPVGQAVSQATYDDGDSRITYDKVAYDIRRAHSVGPLTLRPADGQGVFAAPLEVGRISDLQSIRAPNLVPVLLGPAGEPVISRLIVTGGRPQPKAPVYVVSDPDLLNNQILADPQKVASALNIVDKLSPVGKRHPSVVFNLTFNDMAFDRDLLHALSRPPFVAVPLSLLIFGLGLMWAAFARFGPPRLSTEGAALGRGVRILADNAARLMAVTMKEAKLGPAYAQMIRDEVLRARGHARAGLDESADDLADRIGRQSGAEDLYSDLKRKAATLMTVHQLIDLTQKLHAWKAHIEKTEIDRANI